MTSIQAMAQDVLVWLAALAGGAAVYFGARFAALKVLTSWEEGPVGPPQGVRPTIRRLVSCWTALAAAAVGVHLAPLPAELSGHAGRLLSVLLIVSFAWALAKAALWGLDQLGRRQNFPVSVTDLVRKAAIAVFLAVGLLMVMQNLGIEITPLVAALGIGSLAIPLALGPTLSNLFSGLVVLGARMVRPGDYVELRSGERGYVVNVGWRHTRIRELSNNMILIPNTRLTDEVLKNYHLPEKPLSVLVEVGVAADSDLDQVERATVEVAREVMRSVRGGDPKFEPSVRYHTFGETSIKLTVMMRGMEFNDQYLLRHEFIRRLHHRFVEEGILPFAAQAEARV